MSTDDQKPKKRKRRRRRKSIQSEGGQPSNPPQSTGQDDRARRKKRRRRRGGGGGGGNAAAQQAERIPPSQQGETTAVDGVLYVKSNGQGLLVQPSNNYSPAPGDALVPRGIIDKHRLEQGIRLSGIGIYRSNGLELQTLEQIEEMPVEEYQELRRPFQDLISIDPEDQFKLETESDRLTTRVLDLLVPIGRGQRCLVVAPPKAGKTTLLKDIAHGIETNHPEVVVMVLLVDERPEEVTDIRRSVKGEVIASSSDETAGNHIAIAEVVIERARRLVELKKDVVILCDSITRMSRAYNNEQRSSGRIMSGGIDARTMEKPRRFFGSARNAEDWGSLTIVATALVDTGSRMDEVIFQEFKGTGNTEIVLERGLFERRIFPAMNIPQTGTRKEEKLLDPEVLPKVHTLRRALAGTDPTNAMRMLLDKLQKFKTNEDFLNSF
ncbi:MAG: transcription termination factor Rho [Acidobacteria bacterium]|nr:transcription termination factor Rho [Acidobacteriota bacterium]